MRVAGFSGPAYLRAEMRAFELEPRLEPIPALRMFSLYFSSEVNLPLRFSSIHPISRSNFHETNCVARSFSSLSSSPCLLAFAKCKVRSVLYSYLDARTCLLVQQTALFYCPWFCFNIFYVTFSPFQSFPIMNWMSATAIWFASFLWERRGRSINLGTIAFKSTSLVCFRFSSPPRPWLGCSFPRLSTFFLFSRTGEQKNINESPWRLAAVLFSVRGGEKNFWKNSGKTG